MRPNHVLQLRQLRRARELTQVAIAERVGITTNAYNAIERGRSTPSLSTAREIAKVFALPIEEVFREIEIPPTGLPLEASQQ
jgi:putative transcriptional regulator